MTDYLPGSIKHLNMLLGEQLTEGEGGGGGETWQTVFEGSVTTENTDDGVVGNINYESVINADKIKVTFNGTEYECDKITAPVGSVYGGVSESGPDFSEYPFAISSRQGLETAQTVVYTETAGTYTLKIEEPQSGGSSDFSMAEVTITNNSEVPYELDSAFIIEDSLVVYELALPSSTYTRTVVLYKGLNHMSINDENDDPVPVSAVSMTGDVSYDESEFTITGDCSITISQ